MVYRVIVEATAQQDALDYAANILRESQAANAAAKWLKGLEQSLEGLAEMPHRFRVIDEQGHFAIELRQFVYHSHRVIYHICEEGKPVHVLRIYHGYRSALRLGDILAEQE